MRVQVLKEKKLLKEEVVNPRSLEGGGGGSI